MPERVMVLILKQPGAFTICFSWMLSQDSSRPQFVQQTGAGSPPATLQRIQDTHSREKRPPGPKGKPTALSESLHKPAGHQREFPGFLKTLLLSATL